MKCKGKTQSGQPCKMPALKDSKYCFTHSAHTRQAQAVARKLGGENRHTPHAGNVETIPGEINTLQDAKRILSYTLAEILIHDNTIARARVLLSLFDSFAKSIEIGELESRIAALEAANK